MIMQMRAVYIGPLLFYGGLLRVNFKLSIQVARMGGGGIEICLPDERSLSERVRALREVHLNERQS